MEPQAPSLFCRVEMFGGLRVRQGDRVRTEFPTQKTAALLAHLAYFPQRTFWREELCLLLWPDDTIKNPRGNLNVAISALRSCLTPEGSARDQVFITDRNTVRLNFDVIETDVGEFKDLLRQGKASANEEGQAQRYAEAIDCYEGDLLVGYEGIYDEQEPWILSERDDLKERYLQTLHSLATYHAGRQNSRDAIHYARKAVSADPLREEAHRDLIRILGQFGRISA